MANEPERPIERLLRAAAQKRRDDAGAPFQLHPADRRRLQGEIARKFAPPQPERRLFAQTLAQLWPRLAGGVAMLAVICLAVWVLVPVPGGHKPGVSLARNLPASKGVPAEVPAAPPPASRALGAPPPASPVVTEPLMVAGKATARPALANQPGQVSAPLPLLAQDTSAALVKSKDVPKLELAAAQQLADRQEPAKAPLAGSAGRPAQTTTEAASAAFERRYGLAGQQPPLASPPAPTAAPATFAMTPATATVLPPVESAKSADNLNLKPANAPAVAANELAQQAGDKSGQPALLYKSLTYADSLNRASASPAATDSLSQAAPGVSEEAKSLGVAQRFVQVTAGATASAPAGGQGAATPAVLASFQVEQSGQVLRIVDGDGSVYTGSLQLAEAARRARASGAGAPAAALATRAPALALKQEPTPRLDSDQLAPQTYFFRVAGTNRSLQKRVVFTGNLLTATNITLSFQRATNLSVGAAVGGFQDAPAQPGFPPLLNSRISGKLVIGNGKPVEINALPANP
jgi:hypothetical protein